MKCRFCSCSVENSNERDGYQPKCRFCSYSYSVENSNEKDDYQPNGRFYCEEIENDIEGKLRR